jgi:YggT family protein
MTGIALIYLIVRTLVVVALVYAAIVALTHWAVRSRRLSAFGAWPRFVRRASDPVLQPIERRVLRAGGNPQDAPLWLVGLVIVGGLILLWLLGWVLGFIASLAALSRSGPGAWIYALVRAVFIVLEIALIVRVVSSWIGLGPFNRLVRPAYRLTDWLVVPLRRVLPSFGPFDLSPMLAWILLSWVAQPVVLGLLSRLVTPY